MTTTPQPLSQQQPQQSPASSASAVASAQSRPTAPLDNYEYVSVIGQGSFGRICKVRRKTDGKIVARKEITYKSMKEKEKRQLVQEVNILRELKHSNIVRYYERYVDRENYLIYIIMEFCEGGDLASVIKKTKQEGRHFSEDVVWRYLAQLVDALHYCHHAHASRAANGQSILHRDLKPDNVFLDSSNNAKLGDFGLSTTVGHPEHDFVRTFVGTPYYMSPELVNETSYNVKSDLWALGCLIYELCALEPPFTGNSHRQLHDNIRSGRYPPLPSQYSVELRNVIRHLLCVNPEKRMSAAELIKHPRIQHTLREKEYENWAAEVKRREDEVKRREQLFNAKEEEFRKYVQQVEEDMKRRAEAKEKELNFRESTVLERERKLALEVQRINGLRRPLEERNRQTEPRKHITPKKHAAQQPVRHTRYSENFASDVQKSMATMDLSCVSMDISPVVARTAGRENTAPVGTAGGNMFNDTNVFPYQALANLSLAAGPLSPNDGTRGTLPTPTLSSVPTGQPQLQMQTAVPAFSAPASDMPNPFDMHTYNARPAIGGLVQQAHDFSVPLIQAHAAPNSTAASSPSSSSSSSENPSPDPLSPEHYGVARRVSTSASAPSSRTGSVFKVPARLAKSSANRRYSMGTPAMTKAGQMS